VEVLLGHAGKKGHALHLADEEIEALDDEAEAEQGQSRAAPGQKRAFVGQMIALPGEQDLGIGEIEGRFVRGAWRLRHGTTILC